MGLIDYGGVYGAEGYGGVAVAIDFALKNGVLHPCSGGLGAVLFSPALSLVARGWVSMGIGVVYVMTQSSSAALRFHHLIVMSWNNRRDSAMQIYLSTMHVGQIYSSHTQSVPAFGGFRSRSQATQLTSILLGHFAHNPDPPGLGYSLATRSRMGPKPSVHLAPYPLPNIKAPHQT